MTDYFLALSKESTYIWREQKRAALEDFISADKKQSILSSEKPEAQFYFIFYHICMNCIQDTCRGKKNLALLKLTDLENQIWDLRALKK